MNPKRRDHLGCLRCICFIAMLILLPSGLSQSGLQITYGANGPETLAFEGVVLDSTHAFPADSFHIYHLQTTDLHGKELSAGQYGWGETNDSRTWNPISQTMTYTFLWGSIATKFIQNGENLDLSVTETNLANSGIIFEGAEIYPFILHFPNDPVGFAGYSQYAITTTGPGVTVADYGLATVTSVVPDESPSLYSGWKNLGANTYSPLMTTTAPDGLPAFLPSVSTPVSPGTSFTYTVSLRFSSHGTTADASDAYASFASKYPNQMTWSDRRILGTAYLASSPADGNINQPGGFPKNPRRYFNDSTLDITTASGLKNFQNRMLEQANANVQNARAMNGQGVITWDIEGEQYPQNTSYVCSPEQIATLAPEMESAVLDASSPYHRQRLDDAYFKIQFNAGLKVGLCLRPQKFVLASDGTASQTYLNSNAEIIANLENKVRFANSRWGVTIFYIDSTVDLNGGTLDPSIFQQLISDFPSFLFIPEESTPRYYAYSAPFYSFIFHTDVGTPASIYNIYPQAFGANLVNDVSAATLTSYQPKLTSEVADGDILMGHADYDQENDRTLAAIYEAAGLQGRANSQTKPPIAWSSPASIIYGTPLSSAQLNASSSVPGTFVYSPSVGTVLPAGQSTLLVTFMPTNTSLYSSVTASTNLTVNQASPNLSWPTPSPIPVGTTLSTFQLNASATVPGTFVYSPGPGTVLSPGSHTLDVTFSPSDTGNYVSVSGSVSLSVIPAGQLSPTITWNPPSPIPYGTPLSSKQLDATSTIAGTFLYSPPAGTTVPVGNSQLLVVFTPADSSRYATAISVAPLVVTKAQPDLSWPTPSPVAAGTPLSSSQLNASSTVPGSFLYSPAVGTLVSAGQTTLAVTFTPLDTVDYTSRTVTVMLEVDHRTSASSPANGSGTPVSTQLKITSPTPDESVSGNISIHGDVSVTLDAAGSYLILDGVRVGPKIGDRPYLYPLDTTSLSNGSHTLQLWAHDIGDNTEVSQAVTIVVENE
jgi:hypothetical protein